MCYNKAIYNPSSGTPTPAITVQDHYFYSDRQSAQRYGRRCEGLVRAISGNSGNPEIPANCYLHHYDARGNIAWIEDENSAVVASYAYDAQNRLIRENNTAFGETYIYGYDNNDAQSSAGNITSRKTYAYTTAPTENLSGGTTINYGYNSGRLSNYDGESVGNYDAAGNPRVYRGAALSWSRMRNLSSYTKDGKTERFAYDGTGVRIKKNNINYTVSGTQILAEEHMTEPLPHNNKKLVYFYDESGVCGFEYDGDYYYYLKNLLGDVTGIFKVELFQHYSTTSYAAEYRYDAWGNHKVLNPDGSENTDAAFIGNINPFRYRSCYFDRECGLYYMNSRYYDPEVGRFINADDVSYLDPSRFGGLNLYSYCANNPVMLCGSNMGLSFPHVPPAPSVIALASWDAARSPWMWYHWAALGVGAVLCIAAAGILIAGAVGAITTATAAGAIALGAASGTLKLAAWGAASGALGGMISAGLAGATGDDYWNRVGQSAAISFGISAVMGAVTGGIQGYMNYSISDHLQCFAAGTVVKTEDGDKKIEDIQPGDEVLAYDEKTGETAYKKVVRLFRNTTDRWQHVYIEGEDEAIKCTPGHKFYLPKNERYRDVSERQEHEGYVGLSEKWVSAKDLKKGDRVLLSDGKYGIVKGIKLEKLDTPETTYNFEVEDFHTYYVGENGVCVHNRGCNGLKPDPNATGDHSTFARDPATGKVTKYATYKQNPYRPSGFDEVLRFDRFGGAHNGVPTPHIHIKSLPGGVRPALPWEMPL